MESFCARNYRASVSTHKCTGGPYCKGSCKPKQFPGNEPVDIEETLAQEWRTDDEDPEGDISDPSISRFY